MLDLDFRPGAGDAPRDGARRARPPLARSSVVRQLEDDPVGYPPELWKQLGHLDLIGLLLPEEYGGSGMTALEGVVALRGVRPGPGPVAALRQLGPVRGRAGPAGQRRAQKAAVAAGRSSPGEAILTPAWLEPENGFRPRGVAGAGRAPTATGSTLTGREAPRGLRLVGRPAGRAGPDGRRRRGRRPLPGRPDRRRGDADPAVHHRLGHPVRGGRSTGCGWARPTGSAPPGPAGPPGRGDARAGPRAAGRPGRRRGPLRPRDHRSSTPRTATSSTSRWVPSRRWPTTWPTPSPPSTAPSSWSTRRPGPAPSGRPRRPSWPRWPSCSPARPSATSRPWPSRSSAASASRVEFDIQLYFRRAKQQQLMWANDRALEVAVAAALLD